MGETILMEVSVYKCGHAGEWGTCALLADDAVRVRAEAAMAAARTLEQLGALDVGVTYEENVWLIPADAADEVAVRAEIVVTSADGAFLRWKEKGEGFFTRHFMPSEMGVAPSPAAAPGASAPEGACVVEIE